MERKLRIVMAKPRLEAKGVTGNFGPGTPLDRIVSHIFERVRRERWERG